jgi:predicted amidohydrolase YtcJ
MGPRLSQRGLVSLIMATSVFTNGRVFTGNGNFEEASILVEDAVIRNIIPAGEPLGVDVKVDARVDIDGACVLPGFVDSHVHLTALALNKLRCDLSAAASARGVCETLSTWAEGRPDASMLVGVDFDESVWTSAQLPTRLMLDGVDDSRPVLVRRVCGHIGVVNSALLKRLTKRPDLIDEDTGLVREHALWDAGRLWAPEPSDVIRSYQSAIEDLHRLGITTIHDIVEPDSFEMYVGGVSKSTAPLRIDALVHTNPRDLEYYKRVCAESGTGDFRVVGVKCFLDGSLGGRTAALNADYADGPGWGTLLLRREVIRALAEECFENGNLLAVHAIGDRAIDLAASALKDFPKETRQFRLEHCEVAGPHQIDRLRWSPLFLSLQPNFVRRWGGPGGLNERRLGKERNRWCHPYRSFLGAGLECVFGSDGMPPGPLWGLKGAIEHPVEAERIPPVEAIACYTRRPHALEAHRRNAGTLEAGRVADMVVLDGNPLTDDLDAVHVLKTVIDGRVVFESPPTP